MSIVFIHFNARPAERRRAPLLEQMLARADGRRRVADWRAHAYRLLSPDAMPAPGPAALCAADGGVPEASAFVASPVHHTAGLSSLSLDAGAILPLSRAEAESLVRDFNRVFSGAGLRLTLAGSAGATLLLAFAAPLRAETHDPMNAVQGDLWEFQPSGPDGPYLRGLMSEMEMWLFDHPVNRARASRGAAPITGLWLWGGGATLEALPRARGWTAGADPLFGALGITEAGGAGAGVVVLEEAPGTAAWAQAESAWLRPAAAQLAAGRIGRVELSAGDQVFSVGPRWRWRFWRSTRPWWEHLR